jgi:peroxiredoxin
METFFKYPFLFLILILLMEGSVHSQPLRLKRATDICNPDSVVLGRISPNFTGTTLSGIEVPISSLRGSFVVIMVWATSTHSSQVEYPFFKKLRARYSNSKIQFLDIAVDKDKKDWEFFFNQNPETGIHWYSDPLKAPFSYYLLKRKDRGEHTYFSYTVPQFILLNPEGRIVENKTGFFPSDTLRFNTLISSLPIK